MYTRRFYEIPRLSLAPLETPVEPMERLAAALPGSPGLHIKRDDFIGPLVWGNKLRKLEYVLARATQEGADTIITCGAVQSNHARTTAMVAGRLGLKCILVLNGEEPSVPERNYRISKMMGATIKLVPERKDREPGMIEAAEEVKSKGGVPFLVPLGASDANGTPGFVQAMFELKSQQEKLGFRFSHIVVSTSSGGTQGGLEAGKRIAGLHDIKIIGISADDSSSEIGEKVMAASNPILDFIGIPHLMMEDLTIDDRFTGPGYGIPSPESERAFDLFLRHEGILLDPTYTGKAAAGLIALIEEGRFTKSDRVLFWHTGGLVNLF
ncbi:MAG: D-cysteine desulfhydrase family protein [Bacteroidales bacterium]|jgi:1-aminocyclopropane-1-carboxylate deaminase/D-cysteine desulfhydrase-like pyridoxal-dependent ACC family enzyme|nr:D-cysteine desulfhydrase family protein [Bacteroidales bacterium]